MAKIKTLHAASSKNWRMTACGATREGTTYVARVDQEVTCPYCLKGEIAPKSLVGRGIIPLEVVR